MKQKIIRKASDVGEYIEFCSSTRDRYATTH